MTDMTDKAKHGSADVEMRMMQVTHDHLLNEAVKITQPADGYRVGTDAVLLAASVATDSGRILDLGAGVGGVSLCMAHRLREIQVTAVEKHGDLAAIAEAGGSCRIRGQAADNFRQFEALPLAAPI